MMPGGYQTLVIDTIDWAEQLCVEHICAQHQKKGIEEFPYGTGYVFVRVTTNPLDSFISSLGGL